MNAKLKWDSDYPDKKILRKEINFMLEAFMEVLLKEIPASEIKMIYKRNTCK